MSAIIIIKTVYDVCYYYTQVEDSSICSGRGDYECSTCICDDN